MGLHNTPAIHQHRVNQALRRYIGKFCHIYLDDIVIWSNSVDEHCAHARKILQALQNAGLYCNLKKTKLFQSQIHFLGHTINTKGIFPDNVKIECILNWPVPTSAKEFMQILTKLTDKEADLNFPEWTAAHQSAFQSIKDLVLSGKLLDQSHLSLSPLRGQNLIIRCMKRSCSLSFVHWTNGGLTC